MGKLLAGIGAGRIVTVLIIMPKTLHLVVYFEPTDSRGGTRVNLTMSNICMRHVGQCTIAC